MQVDTSQNERAQELKAVIASLRHEILTAFKNNFDPTVEKWIGECGPLRLLIRSRDCGTIGMRHEFICDGGASGSYQFGLGSEHVVGANIYQALDGMIGKYLGESSV